MQSDFLIQAQFSTFSNAVQSIIGRTCLIEFGIVKEIIAKGIVRVVVSVAKEPSDVRILNCILIVPSASSVMVNIEPQINDKVIVFFPRRFNSGMFQIDLENADAECNDIIKDDNGEGFTPFTGLAMLANQFRPNEYFNSITLNNGMAEIKLAYSSDDSKNLLTVSTNEKGEVSVKSNAVSLDVKSDNSITIDTSKAKVNIDKDGNITVDAMSGKLTLKNSRASLFDILNNMLRTLNTTLSTSGSPAKHVVDPNQFQQQATDLSNLMQ